MELFFHNLALELGRPVCELADLPSPELDRWIRYATHHGPLGPARWELLYANLCAVINSAGYGKRRQHKARKFLPSWWRRNQTTEEMVAILEGTARAYIRGRRKRGSD